MRLAVGLAGALRELHSRNLIHKDVKPTNVLVDTRTGQVRLMGFGIASRLRRERQSLEPVSSHWVEPPHRPYGGSLEGHPLHAPLNRSFLMPSALIFESNVDPGMPSFAAAPDGSAAQAASD